MITPRDYCMSSYLAFRYVIDQSMEWAPGVMPVRPVPLKSNALKVETAEDVKESLQILLKDTADGHTGILLSGGIDSAILAAMLPEGTRAYTIRFEAENFIDESQRAQEYAHARGFRHATVETGWPDQVRHAPFLMERKRSPLHAIEVALYKAALTAKEDGVTTLIVGNGADSTFGGMDKLLSRDWTLEEFYKRYTYVDPLEVLRRPVDLHSVYAPYVRDGIIDTQGFLKTVHGTGVFQSFDNAITAAGAAMCAPFERMRCALPLDLGRIRSGDSKYLLRELFRLLYPGFEVPEKIPFSRPMDSWLRNWKGPKRDEFRRDVRYSDMTGDQRWLLYCLEMFLEQLDSHG